MLVIDYNILHAFQTYVNNVVDFVEASVGQLLASGLLQVKTKVVDTPFRSMFIIVVGRCF